jgi:response regulator RpfG family c-di-GMP phosphodiesterase
MTDRILLVDDEPNVLESLKRQLRKRFTVMTAISGNEALQILRESGPFSIILSDMRMPGMDGVELLSQVKEAYPDTVRLMLTGNADQETAMEAVNKGHIFRFLTKPCSAATLITSLALAQRQYRLLTAERELLDKTLKGSVMVLSELLALANPTVFSSSRRVSAVVVALAEALRLDAVWKYEIASLIAQIGSISLPSAILLKRLEGRELDEDEEAMFVNHPRVGAALLENIPRIEDIAAMIAHQLRSFAELAADETIDDDVRIGAELLRLAGDYDLLLLQGNKHEEALRKMKGIQDAYNPEMFSLLKKIKPVEGVKVISRLAVKDVTIGMVVEEDIIAKNGAMLIPKGQEISWAVLQGLRNFSHKVGVQEPVCVRQIER